MWKKANMSRYEGKRANPCALKDAGSRAPRHIRQAHHGFFSLDALMSLLFTLFILSSFIALFSAAAQSAEASANDASLRLLALRASSFLMSEIEERGGDYGGAGYRKAWEISMEKLSAFDACGLAQRAGAGYASFSLQQQGEVFSSSCGAQGAETYCAGRLALSGGKISRLEVCVS